MQHCLVGFNSVSFHAVNVLLHALVCILFWLACRPPVLPRRSQRTLAALLFAVHAVHVECVTNTVGRAELLAAVGFFAAILLHRTTCHANLGGHAAHAAARHLASILGVVALSAGAMLCKEVGLIALPVCAAYDVALVLARRRPRYREERSLEPRRK